jgi:sulfhydrogenase subunit delta
MAGKPRLAVFKFASCDGCQLSLLDAEDELLAVCERVAVVHFAEASSRLEPGPYDITLVEGSITTDEDAQRIREIRRESRFLITIGACATAGGIQALRQWGERDEWVRAVYPRPEFIQTLATSTPIAAHVHVDFELRGCPINQHQLIDVLLAGAGGRRPRVSTHSVCLECKRRGNVCVVVAHGTPCLGPITQSGCGAICPAFDRGCYGCYGPAVQPNVAALLGQLQQNGQSPGQLVPLLRNFNAAAPEFQRASEELAAAAESMP